jgi:hypothetical protein
MRITQPSVHRALRAIAGAALLASAFSASAQRSLDATVEKLGDTVSYSTTTDVYRIGYRVTIKNDGGSTVNNVRFQGTLSIPDGLIAAFDRAEGIAGCSSLQVALPTGPATQVNCTIGTFTAGASQTFAVFFRSPVSSDTIARIAALNASTFYAEGSNDNGQPLNDTVINVVADVNLGTNLPDEVRSALTPDAATFATQPGDALNTRLNVPAQPQRYSSVRIKESLASDTTTCSAQRNFVQCFGTDVDVPGVVFAPSDPNFLTFELLANSSNIRKGTKIDRVVIRYSAPAVPELGIPEVPVQSLQFCLRDANNQPLPNNNYVPCIASATVFTRRTPGWTPQNDGSFRWVIINKKNGRFDLF